MTMSIKNKEVITHIPPLMLCNLVIFTKLKPIKLQELEFQIDTTKNFDSFIIKINKNIIIQITWKRPKNTLLWSSKLENKSIAIYIANVYSTSFYTFLEIILYNK